MLSNFKYCQQVGHKTAKHVENITLINKTNAF